MNSARLLSILAVIIVIAVLIGYLIFPKEKPPQPKTSEPVAGESAPIKVTAQVEPTPPEVDLNSTHPLTREDVVPLYAALQNKIENYKTVHVRTRLEFLVEENKPPLESEFWFDAIQPDHFFFKSVMSTPKDNEGGAFAPLPYRSEIRTGTQMLVINYSKRKVYITDLVGFDKSSNSLAATTLVQCASRMANPLQDLILGMSYENRLKELLEAKRERTSQGEEIHVLFRITGPMSRAIQDRRNLAYLPVTDEALQVIALRKDIFDAASGNPKQSVYLDSEWHPFLVQTYLELEWDGEIPPDRFLSDAPAGSSTVNMSERVSYLHKLGITKQDVEEFRRAGNTSSASAILDLKNQRAREKGLEPSN